MFAFEPQRLVAQVLAANVASGSLTNAGLPAKLSGEYRGGRSQARDRLSDGRPWYLGRGIVEGKINGTTEVVVPIVVSNVGTGIGIVGVLGLVLRILTTNVTKQFEANAAQMTGMKADLGARIDETNRRIDDVTTELGRRIDETNKRIDERIDDTNRQIESLASEMHQGFDRVHRELGENRERMAKLEGSLDGFLAGRRDRAAA